MMQYVSDRTKDDFERYIKKDAGNNSGPIVKDHCLEYIFRKQRVQVPHNIII
jgi:hypothetical protein